MRHTVKCKDYQIKKRKNNAFESYSNNFSFYY